MIGVRTLGPLLGVAALLLAATAQAQTGVHAEIQAPAPAGPLGGMLDDPDGKAPLVVMIPGSGPTDRDGNNPLGVAGGPYRQLAEALNAKGVATLRVDKRGMFSSRAAAPDANHVTIADYAADARSWVDTARTRTGRKCVWLLGHSEGGLVALQAAQDPRGICGVVLVSAAGRPLGTVMRGQFRANPANAPFLDAALGMIDQFEAGRHVDTAALPAPLPQIFPEAVQGYLIDLLSYDPVKLAARVKLPVLVVQGERDIQVGMEDAQALAAADPRAKLVVVPGMTHVLRIASAPDRGASAATYADASLPVAPALVDAIAAFVVASPKPR